MFLPLFLPFQEPLNHDLTFPPLLRSWLTAKTAANHTLHEICKTFGCTEQGAKNAMSRRSITHCADWTHKDGPTWEKKEVKKRPAPEHPIDFLVGKRVFDDGVVQYKVKWSNLDEDQATWEPIPHLTHAKQAISEYEESHPNAPKA